MPISDIARTGVITIHRDQTAGNLATVMKEEAVGSVVVEEDDLPVGIVTDRDLALEVLEPRADPREVTVGDIMSKNPITAHEDDGVFQVTEEMYRGEVRRMPIVDDDGELSGIVTLDDLVVLFSDEMGGLAGVIEAESPSY
ncbi:CBS domain-containing protein [Haloarchaeobius litoreus]|uniref:CBS domain-containing protein n=1 Tax=Haloarchaeobius litoreus TaxID=755306 RepID=A0ABD6DQ34_9EURY|nr:CBS domain-containing protein [Haloarchaeobius litoreus]